MASAKGREGVAADAKPSKLAHPLNHMIQPQVAPPRVADEHAPGEILIKLKANSKVAVNPQQSAPTGGKGGAMPAGAGGGLNQVLGRHGVTSAELVFKRTKGVPEFEAARRAGRTPLQAGVGRRHADRSDLGRWYRLKLPANRDLEQVVRDLNANPEVEAVEPNYSRRLADPPIQGIPDGTTDPEIPRQWHFINAHVQQGWVYLQQNGVQPGGTSDVIVAVIDTGVDYTHQDLVGNMWVNGGEIPGNNQDDDSNGFIDDVYGCSVVSDGRSHAGDPKDLHGHGTHVAGIVAATAYNQLGGCGVAFGTRVMAVRAADYSGVLSVTDVAEGILYAVDNGAEVINMSFGGYMYSQVEVDALEVAFNQAVLVAAAGNDGLNGWEYPSYPAALYFVHGVMASTTYNTRAWFSNYGYDIAAPGESIYSTLPNNQYAAWSGTSMSAPIVSGVAALLRSFFWQRDIYSNRFLMGSIWQSGSPVINTYKALTEPPTPGVSVLADWLFDDTGIDPGNDGDGRVDSGETLHIAVELINRSGQADEVTATLRAHAEGAPLDDPYVTITTPTVIFGSIGPFNTADNGFIYDTEGVIIGVEQPFVFTVDPNCPNDHLIPFELTLTFRDGWDPNHPQYTRISRFEYFVQRGRNVPTVITSGTSFDLTSDEYWIVGGPVLVEAGATLTMHEGTQVQWGAISDDPYNPGPQSGYMLVRGNLEIQGTQAQPVNMFPSYFVSGQRTKITVETAGLCNMQYVKVRNPELSGIRSIDHAYLEWDALSSTITATDVSSTIFHKLRGGGSLRLGDVRTSLFDAGWLSPDYPGRMEDCVFLQDNENLKPLTLDDVFATYARDAVFGYAEQHDGKTYALLALPCNLTSGYNKTSQGYFQLEYANVIAEYLGGHVVVITDSAEQTTVKSYVSSHSGFYTERCVDPPSLYYAIGMSDDPVNPGQLAWVNGEPLAYTNWYTGEPKATPGKGTIVTIRASDGKWATLEGNILGEWTTKNLTYVLELPAGITDADLAGVLGSPELINYVMANTAPRFVHNAFLNPYWDPNLNHWMRIKVLSWHRDPSLYAPLLDNYWGTDSTTLIDHMIEDYYDNFTSARIEYRPPAAQGYETTYPFAESVLINGVSAETVPELGSGPTTFTISFNRDMDTSIQPFVTFGPAPPHTDFAVHPIGDGWIDPRTWEGTFWIVPVTGEGYHLMRISGAVAAGDPWLVSGYDVGRFRFEVRTMGVAAMTLQAVGQEGSILLTWQQNDYDLIAGYNLYRADTANGTYTRINNTIIPVGGESYVDTNVVPAVPKYYKFTVVLTDLTESAFSNVASAAALDTVPPVITHAPPASARPGLGLRLEAAVTDNVSVASVTLNYRTAGGAPDYTSLAMNRISGNDWSVTIPGSAVQPPAVEYYLVAT
ncbi:MAG: S8 family serine peptidase, partial [Planctomycetes bacterium]|nr:S8 family serine peptidase [Planctomycetota bacterium]